MYAEKRLGTFAGKELTLAFGVGLLFELSFFGLLVWAGKNQVHIQEKKEPAPIVVPINMTPVIDDRPLLKLGSKNPKAKPKLPDMWKKVTPTPVRRLEERAAPSDLAKDDVKEIPKSKVADKDHPAPTKDDEIVDKADEKPIHDAEPVKAPESTEEGSPDGSAEGTETDPLKARAVSLYKNKIQSWFNSRFKQPEEIPCEVRKKLRANVRVNVSGDRAVAGFSLTKSSSNAVYDGKVSAFLAGIGGQLLPPPPPTYPDILSTSISVTLVGRCDE
jgi:TonB C terminal